MNIDLIIFLGYALALTLCGLVYTIISSRFQRAMLARRNHRAIRAHQLKKNKQTEATWQMLESL